MQTMTIAAATGLFIGGAGVPASAATTSVTAVTLPAGAQAGSYSATITHSVS
jgi:hypothetical protein